MADFWSGWDPSNKYRIRLRVWEEGSGNGKAKGKWDLAIFGKYAANNFYGYNTSGTVTIDGGRHWTGNSANPSAGWNGLDGKFIASGAWGPTNGNRTISVAATFNATSVPAAYGPTATMSVSASLKIGGGTAAPTVKVPGTITRIEFTNVTARQARIVWWAPGNGGAAINNYGLRVSTKNSADPTGAAHIAYWDFTGLVGEKTLTGLRRGTKYYVFMRAQNSVGWSPYSASKSFTTGAYEAPTAPTGYGVTDVTSETAYTTMPTVSDTGGSALWNVQIQHNASASETGAVTLTAGAYRTVFMSGLTAGTKRFYRMRVCNSAATGWAGAWSPWGAWTSFTPNTTTPSAVQKIAFTPAGKDLSVSWTAPANLRGSSLQGYTVRYAKNDAFSVSAKTLTVTDPSVYLPNLGDGTWWFQIWANSSNGPGAFSVPVSTTLGTAKSSTSLKVGGQWKTGTLWLKVNGVWKPGVLWGKTNGTWRQ